MRLGTASCDITPPVGTLMSGGIHPRTSVGVEDPLLCKAMVLDNGDTRLAIVTLDLLGFPREYSDPARQQIEQRTGIRADHVVINSSHTHSGPYVRGFPVPDDHVDPAYMREVEGHVVSTVAAATETMRAVTVGCGDAVLSGVGKNRRLMRPDGDVINVWLATEQERAELPPAGPVDEQLIAWVFFADGKPVATLWNFTLHVNTHFGTSFSADYPGRAAEALKAAYGDDFFTVFLSATCGDINTVHSYPDTHRMVSVALVKLVNAVAPGTSEELASSLREIVLPVRDKEPFQEAEIRAKWPHDFDSFKEAHERLYRNAEDEIATWIQAVRIGEGAIACTPGETFVSLGLQVKEGSPYPLTAVTELTNACSGYIPTREAFDQGGYETFKTTWSRVVPGSGEAIVEQLVAMLNDG